jgi:predicted MPP superfamily phosphohydrolase
MFDRRRVLKALAGLFFVGVGTTTGYATAWEPNHLRITKYALTPRNWPAGRKLRLAVLSDIHIGGPYMSLERVAEIVATTNGLAPDLVLILGDFVASRARRPDDPSIRDWAGLLRELKSTAGTYAILGNHDWWQDPPTQEARKGPTQVGLGLEAVGIPVLQNDALRVQTPAGPVWVAGLGDQIAFLRRKRGLPLGVDDLPRTLAQIEDDGAPAIMMIHEPDAFARMPARVGLTLAGHTHGGQVRLFGWSPIVPSRYGNRYAYGHVRQDGRDLIVSGGIGTSKLPIRLGVPPEILLVELG